MAQGSEQQLRHLLEEVRVLTEQMSQPNQPNVNAEVSRVFGRSQGRQGNPSSSFDQNASPASSSHFRRIANMRRLGTSSRTNRSRKKTKPKENIPFLCDLILLPGPSVNAVPRQGRRVALTESGHVLNACQFHKAMNEVQVETTIMEAFGETIPRLVDIEILMSVHNKLVKPTLAPGQEGITGVILHRLFKNKPIYVRPNQVLLPDLSEDIETKDDPELKFDDDDDDDDSMLAAMLTDSVTKPSGNPSSADAFAVSGNSAQRLPHTTRTDPNSSSQASQLPLQPQVNTDQSPGQSGHIPDASTPIQRLPRATETDPNSSQASPLPLQPQVNTDQSPGESGHISEADLPSELDDAFSKHVFLHRALLKDDMIELFSDPSMINVNLDVTVIGNDGNPEEGTGVGVMREVLTSFWQLAFHSLTVGTQEKVPCIRHELQKTQWEAIARVIVYGVKRFNYFPIFLSRAVIASVLFGEGSIPSSFLLESFLLYVSQEERETILIALGDKFDPNDGDLLDFLSNFKCFTKVTAGNISRVIHELAHQELLQKPRYIIDCFVPILSVLRAFPAFQTLHGLQEMYLEKKPTPKKIIKLLDANPQNEPQRMALDHLKRHIRSLDGQAVSQFFSFLTGSNVITCESILVTFSMLEGAGRRPIIRTCGPIIELPSTYQSYSELAEEFSSVINEKGAWSFNIV